MPNLISRPGANDLVLVVEDDPKIAELVELYLRHAGFEVVVAGDGLAALRVMREREPALLVLDLMLPRLDGRAVVRVARDESTVPIVILSALGSTPDRVSGLEAGADDYLTKPFAPSELVARVRSVLRRARAVDAAKVLKHGELSVDLERRHVELAGVELELTTAEFELLTALLQARGRVLTRDQLIDRLRPYGEGIQERSIDVYVARLRAKLGDDAARPRFVVTVQRVGYRLGAG